jgi:hypothetical protein
MSTAIDTATATVTVMVTVTVTVTVTVMVMVMVMVMVLIPHITPMIIQAKKKLSLKKLNLFLKSEYNIYKN